MINQNSEKMISFKYDGLKFLDSYSFLASSLDQLSKNLPLEKKVLTHKYFGKYL